MRAKRAAQQIVSVMHVRHPIAQGLVDCVFQCARSGVYGDNLGAKQSHPENVESLAPHVFRAHVDDAVQAEERANCRRRNAVLTCACFGNDAAFAHSLCEQRLAYRIIDLVRASVQKIFALQVDLRPAAARTQPPGVK